MKNRYIKIVLGISLISLLFIKCSEDYLEKEPSGFITAEQISKIDKIDPNIKLGFIDGIYASMYSAYSGGTKGHDDFGQRGYDIYGDMLAGDMVLGGKSYGWYTNLCKLVATKNYTFDENYKVWRFYYAIVYNANKVIEQLGGNETVPELEENKHMMGQMKAMRAFAYFYLANYFAPAYEPSKKILPIYTDTKVPNQGLSSTEEVYTLIVKDLKEAIGYLETFNRRDAKHKVNADVAKGLLTYVYSTMGKNVEAATLADQIIQTKKYALMNKEEVLGGFNYAGTSGWLWGVDLTTDMDLGLISFWGQVDLYSYSYTWAGDSKIINWELFEAIPADDVRKKQFINDKAGARPDRKFYDSRRIVGKQRTMVSDYVYMRIAEMYLLKAENLAKSGDEAGARTALKDLLKERRDEDKLTYIDNLSGQGLLDEIYLQTRIELWGEGKVYLAMKRNKRKITRGSNDLFFPGRELNYNDDLLTFMIPQKEIENNPNLTQQ